MTIGKRFVVAAPTAHFLLRKGGGCSRRMPLRSAMLVATVVSLAALPAAASAQTRAPLTDVSSASGPVSIDVNARPITSFDQRDRSHVRFGALQFRSGLILTSPYRRFGGLSSLRLDSSGERFVSASDKGTWFTGRIVYRGQEMIGLADVKAAPMLAADGRTLASHKWYDTESMARDGDTIYVGIERVNRIVRFDFGRDGVRARAEDIAVPPAIRKLPNNRGLEAMVVAPPGSPLAGTLIAISERGLDANGNIEAFLIGGPAPGSFSVRRRDGFDISDAAWLPNGDLVLLERKFSLLEGVGIRIRRIPFRTIVAGTTIDGPSIFDADLGQEIDNFEGLDVHVTLDGDTVLTLVSDDNFSMIQRTLLLQFTLME